MIRRIETFSSGEAASLVQRARRTAQRAVSLSARLLLAAVFLTAQPALAGMDASQPAKLPADGYAALVDFVQSGGPLRLATSEIGAASPTTAPAATDDDVAVLQKFLADEPGSEEGAPNDEAHASLHAKASFPSEASRSALLKILGGGDAASAPSTALGAVPDDAIHAGLGSAPNDAIHAGLGSAPNDAIHAGLSGGGTDEVAALTGYASGLNETTPAGDATAKAEAPVVMAAAEKKKAPIAKKAEGGEAHYIGSQACINCHRNQAGTFGETLHGDVLLHHPRGENEKLGCEACHGPGSRHAETKEPDGGQPGDIIAFGKDAPRPIEERNAICLSCHEKGDRTYWKGSAHETQNIACTNCHQLMQKVSPKFQMAKSTEAEVCFQCHKDRRAQFERPSHHPLREGDMTCSSCHNPHGSATDKLLREASVNETCYKCHADKRGPFLWEHEPVRDSCLNCHEPHGAVNENLLKVQRPRLCQMCHMGVGHGNPGNPMTAQSVNRSCQNCHTKVHGSNSPAGSLLQR
jgi:DmsE family decaheme c-type cytochrome